MKGIKMMKILYGLLIISLIIYVLSLAYQQIVNANIGKEVEELKQLENNRTKALNELVKKIEQTRHGQNQ